MKYIHYTKFELQDKNLELVNVNEIPVWRGKMDSVICDFLAAIFIDHFIRLYSRPVVPKLF